MPDRLEVVLPRCMRALGIAHLRALGMLRHCRCAQKPGPRSAQQKSKAIEAAADREVAAGSGSSGDPDPT